MFYVHDTWALLSNSPIKRDQTAFMAALLCFTALQKVTLSLHNLYQAIFYRLTKSHHPDTTKDTSNKKR